MGLRILITVYQFFGVLSWVKGLRFPIIENGSDRACRRRRESSSRSRNASVLLPARCRRRRYAGWRQWDESRFGCWSMPSMPSMCWRRQDVLPSPVPHQTGPSGRKRRSEDDPAHCRQPAMEAEKLTSINPCTCVFLDLVSIALGWKTRT